MPRVRLTGLFLFITSIILGLASAATQTTHLRFKRLDRVVAAEQAKQKSETVPGEMTPPTNTGIQQATAPLQFMSIPIVYPLAAVGLFGLILWFVPATELPSRSSKSRGRRRSTR